MGGRDQAKPRRSTPRAGQRLGALGVAFFMVACAGQDTRAPAEADLSVATRLFSVGYRDITDIYISDVTVARLALAGLNGLSSVDPEIAVTQGQGRVQVALDGQPVGSFAAPDRGDAEGWGNLTAAAIGLSRVRSAELSAAEPERLYELVFDGVLGELDHFSRYAGREEAREHRASRDGFGGIGVRIRLDDEGVRILSVMEHTPAAQAGLHSNDVITQIDGRPTAGLSQREVIRHLRGPLRSTIELTIERAPEPAPLKVQVVRAHIVPQTVTYARLGNVAYIRIGGFNQHTARSLREKVRQGAEEIGPVLAGYVLDLRGNPGGLLDQAIAVSDLFLTSGRILTTHGRHPDSHQYFDAAPDDLARNKPVAVLVNGNSASASEIVAAALQDTGRAIVVGTTSFGKGTVQTVLRLPNEGELTLTWARFHAPSGYGLNGRGVMPDICTAGDSPNVDQVLDRLRRGFLPIDRAMLRREIAPNDGPGLEAFRAACPPGPGEPEVDLEVARRLLEDPQLFARALGGEPRPETAEAAHAPQPALAHKGP